MPWPLSRRGSTFFRPPLRSGHSSQGALYSRIVRRARKPGGRGGAGRGSNRCGADASSPRTLRDGTATSFPPLGRRPPSCSSLSHLLLSPLQLSPCPIPTRQPPPPVSVRARSRYLLVPLKAAASRPRKGLPFPSRFFRWRSPSLTVTPKPPSQGPVAH